MEPGIHQLREFVGKHKLCGLLPDEVPLLKLLGFTKGRLCDFIVAIQIGDEYLDIDDDELHIACLETINNLSAQIAHPN